MAYSEHLKINKAVPFYSDWGNVFELLTDEEAGRLIKHIFRYINGYNHIPPDLITTVAFIPMQLQIDADEVKSRRGVHNWNWKDGVTPVNSAIRNGTAIREWRKNVFCRDSYTCKHCGKVGGVLHAHHIKEFSKHPELRFELSNGLTLCKPCHIRHHKKSTNNG